MERHGNGGSCDGVYSEGAELKANLVLVQSGTPFLPLPCFYLIAAGRIYLIWISSDGDCSL